jgi:hypothetical protein
LNSELHEQVAAQITPLLPRFLMPVANDFSFSKAVHTAGASKIKLKKVNKKRTVTVRRVVIFLNISRHPLLI